MEVLSKARSSDSQNRRKSKSRKSSKSRDSRARTLSPFRMPQKNENPMLADELSRLTTSTTKSRPAKTVVNYGTRRHRDDVSEVSGITAPTVFDRYTVLKRPMTLDEYNDDRSLEEAWVQTTASQRSRRRRTTTDRQFHRDASPSLLDDEQSLEEAWIETTTSLNSDQDKRLAAWRISKSMSGGGTHHRTTEDEYHSIPSSRSLLSTYSTKKRTSASRMLSKPQNSMKVSRSVGNNRDYSATPTHLKSVRPTPTPTPTTHLKLKSVGTKRDPSPMKTAPRLPPSSPARSAPDPAARVLRTRRAQSPIPIKREYRPRSHF